MRALANVIVATQRDGNEQQCGEEKNARAATQAMLQGCHSKARIGALDYLVKLSAARVHAENGAED